MRKRCGEARVSRRRVNRNYFIPVEDDGLLSYDIGRWADDKYRHVGMYAEMFATGMKNHWDSRVYIDLFSGPGYSQLRGTTRYYLGSPLIALSLPNPFDRYIVSDENERAVAALRSRVSSRWPGADVRYVIKDANESLSDVASHLPDTGSVLCFCFLDPYKLNIAFETVRGLATRRNIDFLILLALYVDANRNVERYVSDESEVIDQFLGDRDWRDRWAVQIRQGNSFVPFLADEYSTRMRSLGYLPMALEDMVKVRTSEKRLPLYYLAFYSRHPLGLQFWKEVRKYSTDQLDLAI
jgi:three-Cys-motif partner protein